MFDNHVDAFFSGHFAPRLDARRHADGDYIVSFTTPNGQVLEAKNSSLNEANRRCTDLIRDGVQNQTIQLGR